MASEPQAEPAAAGEPRGPELVVELLGAVRLGRALDALERDVLDAAGGGRAGAAALAEHGQPAQAGAAPQAGSERRAAPGPRRPRERLLGLQLTPRVHAHEDPSERPARRYGLPATVAWAGTRFEVRLAAGSAAARANMCS